MTGAGRNFPEIQLGRPRYTLCSAATNRRLRASKCHSKIARVPDESAGRSRQGRASAIPTLRGELT